jgi:hypothetical protein
LQNEIPRIICAKSQSLGLLLIFGSRSLTTDERQK